MSVEAVIAVYFPRPGQEKDLETLLARHLPILREVGFATEKAAVVLKSSNNTYVEIFEWVDGEAAKAAHSHPRISEIWGAIAKIADFKTLSDLPEAGVPFSHFSIVNLERSEPRTRTYTDTMIAAKDYRKLAGFYRDLCGLGVVQETEHFFMLRDPETRQSLCITNGPSVSQTSPGLSVINLEQALNDVERLGGKVRNRWEYQPMKGANCQDSEGNEVMIWEIKK
jgi:predicted enzyme related to lactoylglutathione lyase